MGNIINELKYEIPDDLPKPTEEEYMAAILRLAAEAERTKKAKFHVPGQDDDDDEKEGFLEKMGLYTDDEVVFPETNEDGVLKALGRKRKVNLRTLLRIIQASRFLTSSKHTVVLYFAQTSGRLLDVFGNASAIYHAVRLGVECGLLQEWDGCLWFKDGDRDNECTMYAWNKAVEHIILDIARKHRVRARLPKSTRMRRARRNHGRLVAKAMVKAAGQPIMITQKAHLPLSLTDDEIVDALRHRYPQLCWAQDVAIRLNERLPDDEQISASPKITRAATRITKIGFRISNPLVSAKEHHTDKDEIFTGRWRKDVLAAKLGKWIHYDVKSSIYRVTYFLRRGVWLPRAQDLYAMMAGFRFPTKTDRDNFKVLAMKLYFDDAPGSIVIHLVGKGVSREVASKSLVTEARRRALDVCGGTIRSEIFLHESCIYLEAFRRMVEDWGWRVIQVYDSFYVRHDDGMDAEATFSAIDKLIADCAYWYQATFLRGVNQDDPTLITSLDKGALQQ